MKNKLMLLLLVVVLYPTEICFGANYSNLPLTNELVYSGITIVDIRTEPEWRQTGVVPASILLTFYAPDRSYDLEDFIAELGRHAAPDQEIALLCRSGNRSARLAGLLSERGFTSIINITGGIRRAGKNKVELEHYPATQ
jgi:rhodanese-related sulfurtransferase